MKAQARKILALIMAMVMSLSLAAPAFAEAEEAPESSAPAAVEVEETEAPEKEEEEEKAPEAQEAKEEKKADKLDVQDENTVYVKGITYSSGDKAFVVKGGKYAETHKTEEQGGGLKEIANMPTIETIALADITGSTYSGTYVDVTKGDAAVGLIGGYSQTTYRVTSKSLASENGEAVTEDFTIASTEKNKLSDIAADKWVALTDTNNWFRATTNSKYYEVSGSYYLEKQTDVNQYKVYFKLAKYENKAFQTITDKKVVWAVAADRVTSTTISDAQMNSLLAGATTIKVDASTDENTNKLLATDNTAVKEIQKSSEDAKTYTYTVLPNSVNGATVATDGVITISGLNGGSFKVDVTYPTTVENVATVKKEVDPDAVRSALMKKNSYTYSGHTLEVSGPDADNYFTVTVTKPASGFEVAEYYTGTPEFGGNTAKYTLTNYIPGSEKYTAETSDFVVLVDSSNTGSYTAASEAATVPKNYKLAGPVAISKEFIDGNQYFSLNESITVAGEPGATVTAASLLNDGWYYFDSVSEMAAFVNYSYCGSDGTLQYVQLNITGDESNKGTTISEPNASGVATVTAVEKWATTTGADIVARTASIPAAEHNAFTVVETTNPTCKKVGSETTSLKCKKCGKEITSTSKTLPKVEVALVLGTEQNHYQPSSDQMLEIEAKPEAQRHYIESYKTETVNESKTAEGLVVTTYTCNLGEVHTELTKETKVAKTTLQPTGKWDYIEWGTQNAANVRDYSSLFGWSPSVDDTDVDYTTVPVKNAFTWATPSDLKYDAESGCYYNLQAKVVPTVYAKDATGKTVAMSGGVYGGMLLVKDIKNGEKDCVDGSAKIEIHIYKFNENLLATQAMTNEQVVAKMLPYLLPAKVEETISKKQAEEIKSFTKDVVVPAEKTHVDANNDGKCDNCSAEINQSTPVNENTVDISKAVVKFDALTYTGKAAQPTVTVTLDGVKLAKGIDYDVEEMQAVNVGTYPLIVKGKGDFSGRVVGNVTIKKASQKLTLKVTAPSAKKLKKKAQKVSYKVSGNKTAYTVKATGPVTVKGTTITAKKGTKKNKKIKVTVTAAANDNYNGATATKTVKVKK